MACAVMPEEVTRAALPADTSFLALVQDTGAYLGKEVIVGGYVLEVVNQAEQSRILVLQAPLGTGQEPKAKDLSQGRLILLHAGFIDPEVYAKERKITVAGKLLGSSTTDTPKEPYPYIRIQTSHIHLWPMEREVSRDPRWDYRGYPPYSYPWGWRYPYGW